MILENFSLMHEEIVIPALTDRFRRSNAGASIRYDPGLPETVTVSQNSSGAFRALYSLGDVYGSNLDDE